MSTTSTNPFCPEDENKAVRVCELCPEKKIQPKGSVSHAFLVKNGAVVPTTGLAVRTDKPENFSTDMLELEKAGLAIIIRCTKGSTTHEDITGEGRCRTEEEVKNRNHTVTITDYDAFENMSCTNLFWKKVEADQAQYHLYYGTDIAGFVATDISLIISHKLEVTDGLDDDLVGEITFKWKKKDQPCTFVYDWNAFKSCPTCAFVTATANGTETIAQPTANPLVIEIAAGAALNTSLEFDCACITSIVADTECPPPAWVTIAQSSNPADCDDLPAWALTGTAAAASCDRFKVFVTACNGLMGYLEVTIKTV